MKFCKLQKFRICILKLDEFSQSNDHSDTIDLSKPSFASNVHNCFSSLSLHLNTIYILRPQVKLKILNQKAAVNDRPHCEQQVTFQYSAINLVFGQALNVCGVFYIHRFNIHIGTDRCGHILI